MEEAELKALYIKRMQELIRQHGASKHQALGSVYRPLIEEVTPWHTSSMAAAVSVAMVYRELSEADGYSKKKKRK